MTRTNWFNTITFLAVMLGSGSSCLAREMPDFTVAASIEPSTKQAGACVVRTEVREARLNTVLAALPITLASGEQGTLLTLGGGHRIHIDISPSLGCAGGAYSVVVFSDNASRLEKMGELKPVSR